MAKAVLFDAYNPPKIHIELAVNRLRVFADDGVAQICGHVGDYEVAAYLPLDDERVRALLKESHGQRAGSARRSDEENSSSNERGI